MTTIKYKFQESLRVLLIGFLLTSFSLNQATAQCDPSTIDPCEIGNNSIIQACYHAQIAKTSNGYSITGEDLFPNGFANQTSLTNIPSGSYPMPQDVFPVWGAIGGRTQAVFLGSDETIYAVGQQGLIIDASHTISTAWNPTRLSLPLGITVCDVNKWEGAAGAGNDPRFGSIVTGSTDGFLVFSTELGEAYITGRGASAIQSQASISNWTKIQMPNDVLVADFAVGYRTLLIQGNDGNLYASGQDTYLGDGTKIDLDNLTLLSSQPTISAFGIAQIQAGFNSYFVLDGDGTVHVLGENSEGALGVGNTNEVSNWSKVGAICAGGALQNVAYISTVSTHDYRINSSAILVDGTIRSWGMNSRQCITSGNDRIFTCPITPAGNNVDAVAISNGGHITPYVNTSAAICNIGHNRDGAFGDGNDENGDYGEYTCRAIPGMPEICGTKEADLALEKTVNDFAPNTGDDIVFTITVTNNGPEPSTGSFVRDQLNPAFYYLSDDSDGSYNSSTGLWMVGPLEVGESRTLNITVKVIAPGSQSNYAQVLVDNEVDITSTPGDNSFNQDDDDEIELEVFPCPISKLDTLLCPGDSLLIASGWIYEPGLFVESIPLGFECDSLHLVTVQYVVGPPSPELQGDCDAMEYTLSLAPNSSWNPFWDNGDNTNETIYSGTAGEAVLTLEAVPNCVEQVVIDLPAIPTIDQIPVLKDTSVLELTPLTINSELNTDEWQVQWSPESIVDCADCMVVDIVARESTVVTIYMEHISGCTFESSFFLTVDQAPRNIFAPDVFSPDDNGINDIWTVFTSQNILIEECKIYGRWGSLVYESDGVPQWNGKINDTDCEQGVYVYYIKYSAGSESGLVESGEVTLVR